MKRIYHRPIGLEQGSTGEMLVKAGQALPLAGGSVCFTHVEILRRGNASQIVSVQDWRPDDLIRERMTGSRTAIAGLSLSDPIVMGILNVTPDSFSDGGQHNTVERGVKRAVEMREEGAQIIDIGGESTRPGSNTVSIEDELERVKPVIEQLSATNNMTLSIDTRKPDLMVASIGAGAAIINDVSALGFDNSSLDVAANLNCPVVLTHVQGDPKTMQDAPSYEDVLLDVYDFLEGRVEACEEVGIDRSQIIVDPGIGFGKTLEHNMRLLSGLSLFHGLGCPILLGASRKRFIAMRSKGEKEGDRLGGSVAAALEGARQGVQILRVHDVKETVQALQIFHLVS